MACLATSSRCKNVSTIILEEEGRGPLQVWRTIIRSCCLQVPCSWLSLLLLTRFGNGELEWRPSAASCGVGAVAVEGAHHPVDDPHQAASAPWRAVDVRELQQAHRLAGQAKDCQEKEQVGMDTVRFVGLRDGPASFVEAIEEAGDQRMAAMLTEWMVMAIALAKREKQSNGVGDVSLGDDPSAAPCCIISDMFGGWTHAVAKKFAIPSHVLFTSPAACAAMQLTIPKFLAEGILPLPMSTRTGPVSVPGMPPVDLHDLPQDLISEEPSIKFKFYTRYTLQLSEVTCILVNSFYDLEKSVFDAVNAEIQNSTLKIQSFAPIGPLLAVEDQIRQDRHPAEKWLDTQKEASVIYAAFGTGEFFLPEQIRELAQGLEASEQPFILVLQLSETDNSEAEYFPPGFKERTKERGVVVMDWAPQMRILNHPAVGAFMTHCGWNSSLESIAAGVPMLAWPMMAEQKMNCSFLVDTAKLAIEVSKGEEGFVEKAEVESVVRLMMQESLGSEIRTRAKTIRGLAHLAVAPD